MDKKTIRRTILKRRKDYNESNSRINVIKEIIDSKIIDSCNNIGIYFPINNEIDITELIKNFIYQLLKRIYYFLNILII